MINIIRFTFAGLALLWIGNFLYTSVGFVGLGPTMSQPDSPKLLLAIWLFVVIETVLIAIVHLIGSVSQTTRLGQLSLGSMLITTAILIVPLLLIPIYKTAVNDFHGHLHPNLGLPIWLFTLLAYTMLLPIMHCCIAAKAAWREIFSE